MIILFQNSHRYTILIFLFLLPSLLLSQPADEYHQGIEKWRDQRVKSLQAAHGWPTLVGLYWLKEGENTFGSGEDNDIQFPAKTPSKMGTILLSEDVLYASFDTSVKIHVDGQYSTETKLDSDADTRPSMLSWNAHIWYIIKRGDRYGIRLRDTLHTNRSTIKEIPHFSVDKNWRIKARFIPAEKNQTIKIDNIVGLTSDSPIEGYLEFTLNGKSHRLTALNGGSKNYWVIFGDATNGEESYGGGRYLYVPRANEENLTYIDFNKAYNPPCVFTYYATCPLPPEENLLDVAIESGEKYFEFEEDEGKNHTAEKLHQIFNEYTDWQRKEWEKNYPDVTPEAEIDKRTFLNNLVSRLRTIKPESLSNSDQVNMEVFLYVINDQIEQIDLEYYLIPFNAEGGFYNSLSFAIRGYSFKDLVSYQKYCKKLEGFPAFMEDNISLMKLGMKKGIVSPKLIASNYKGLIQPYMEKELKNHFLFKPFLEIPDHIDSNKRDSLYKVGEKILSQKILPAYEAFNRFMQDEYIPAAKDKIGVSEVTNGNALYEQRVRFYTSLDMSPEDVFQQGKIEVARIRSEMDEILASLEFKGSYEDFLDFLRTDPQFYAETPRELLMEASYIAKKVDGKLPEYFYTLPRLPYGVTEVPASIAPNYTAGRYSGGSVKDHRAGFYWVNTYNLPSRTLYTLPALTLHEAVPGHHLQNAIAQELENIPEFRNYIYLSAFGEGWALYTEWLGKEMGIYETPYEDFGRLTYEMWRACRLVVDVGMHYKGWSREKAFDFLSSNTALSLHECNTEIDRYIGWPGQAVSYKIGELKIKELRKLAEEKLDDRFDIRSFHDQILKNGSIPLYVLEKVIHEYIEEELAKS